jgi:hypothetical protein
MLLTLHQDSVTLKVILAAPLFSGMFESNLKFRVFLHDMSRTKESDKHIFVYSYILCVCAPFFNASVLASDISYQLIKIFAVTQNKPITLRDT